MSSELNSSEEDSEYRELEDDNEEKSNEDEGISNDNDNDNGDAASERYSEATSYVTESDNSATSAGDSDQYDDNVMNNKNKADLLSDSEKARARAVFAFCSTHFNKEEINEEQFNKALALLGVVEKMEIVRDLFLERQSEHIDCSQFLELLVQLREKSVVGDLMTSIQSAFDAIYEGTCELDDQRDALGRKYLLASDLRNLLTTVGMKLSVEEAAQLVRETHPVLLTRPEGGSVEVLYLEQYKAMLLDTTV